MAALEVLFSGLVLASISGLVVVAYRHPTGYHELSRILLFVSAATFIGVAGYDFGAAAAVGASFDQLDTPTWHRVKTAVSEIRPNFILFVAIWGGSTFGLILLRFLPIMGISAPKQRPEQEVEGKRD